MKHLCVFCGSNPGRDGDYVAAASALGKAMASRNCALVYGGGSQGMMGTVANSVLAAGGEAIGVVPRGLFAEEHIHRGLSELITVANMAERKARMIELCDGFVVLPGGLGTLDELFEMWVNSQLEIEVLPVGLLNVSGYYDDLLTFLDHSVREGFVRRAHRQMLLCDSSAEKLVEQLLS